VALGARAYLVPEKTDDSSITVAVEVFATLADGRRIAVDPGYWEQTQARFGAGAIGVSFRGDVKQLPSFDRELFARDPDRAVDEALERDYSVRPHDIEDIFRQGMAIDPDLYVEETNAGDERHWSEYSGDLSGWTNLAHYLDRAGVGTSVERLVEIARRDFAVQYDDALLTELTAG
jgi:hypothetical protein